MKKVIFVCMGNICRSPTGQGVMESVVTEQGRDHEIQIDSAGTIGYHTGRPADPRMQEAASRRGYDLTSLARQVTLDDCEEFDLLIAMDRDNLDYLKRLDSTSQSKMKLLSEYLDDSWPTDVPDPYYGGGQGFETVLDMIETACPIMLNDLLQD